MGAELLWEPSCGRRVVVGDDLLWETTCCGSRVVGDELWETSCSIRQTDRRTDMTKLAVAFRNFVNAPKNEDLDVLGCCAVPSGTVYSDRRLQRECRLRIYLPTDAG